MKRSRWLLFSLLMFIPFFVSAETEEMELVATKTKYFKTTVVLSTSEVMRNSGLGEISSITTEITKEEYDNVDVNSESAANSSRDISSNITETTYKELITNMYKRNDYYFRYHTTLNWKLIPSTRSYDIIGIGFYNTLEPSSIYFEENYCRSSSECYQNTSYYRFIGLQGVGAMFKVPSGTLTELSQYIEFDVAKKNPNATITNQFAVGDYRHATSSIPYEDAKNFTITLSGVQLDSSIRNYYDTITPADAEWTGTW